MSSAPTPDSQGRPPKLSQVMEKKNPFNWPKAINQLKEANSAIMALGKNSPRTKSSVVLLFQCLETVFPSSATFERVLEHLGRVGKVKYDYQVKLEKEEITIEQFFDLLGKKLGAAKINVECFPMTNNLTERKDLLRQWNLLFLNNELADIPDTLMDLPKYELNDLANTILNHNFLPAFRALHSANEVQWLDHALQKLDSATNQWIQANFMKKFFSPNTESDAVKYFEKVLISKESPASLRSEFWETLLHLAFVSHIVKEEEAAKVAKEKAAEEAKKKAAEEAKKKAAKMEAERDAEEYDMLEDVTSADFDKHLKLPHQLKSLARHRTFSRHSNPLLNNFSLRQQGRMLAAYQKAETSGY